MNLLPGLRSLFVLLLLHCGSGEEGSEEGGESQGEPKDYSDIEPHWFLVPLDDLGAFEALEYAILRINEMRKECDNFHLAPLIRSNYNATEVYVRDYGIY